MNFEDLISCVGILIFLGVFKVLKYLSWVSLCGGCVLLVVVVRVKEVVRIVELKVEIFMFEKC